VAFERGSDEVSCTLAGHPPAVVLRGDATTELLITGGPLLGVFPDARYDSTTVKFSANDALVAFSDGVTESETDSAEEFSLQRVSLTLVNHARVGALQKVNALLEAARVFSAEGLKDDASALVIQRS
jgi:serine phosphatase RsbU (regulator of sigma subunit)